MTKVALIIGSLRRESWSRKLAAELRGLAPAQWQLTELPIGGLALYNADLEADPPREWLDFRAAIRDADALLFVSPEYNRSLPGSLKNAVDVASKPNGQNCWPGKPALVMTQSTGPLGGLAGSYALKQVLAGVNVATMPHPEVYLSRIATLFDGEGHLVADTQAFLRGVLASFETWIARFAPR